MFQTSIWRPSAGYHWDPLGRPADYTSQRQELAKAQGRTHFQLASSAMASAPTASSSGTSTPSSSSHALSTWGTSSSAYQQQQPRRGRSTSVRHLWAYSPERAHVEVQEEEEWYRQKRLIALEQEQRQQDFTSYQPALSLFEKAREIIGVDDDDDDYDEHDYEGWKQWNHSLLVSSALAEASSDTIISSPSTTASDASTSTETEIESPLASPPSEDSPRHETPPASTSLLPILARPPADIVEPTALEHRAYNAEEQIDASDEDQLSYLYPPQQSGSAAPSPSAPVLYTRSQLPTLDLASRHLWHALHDFRAVTDDYALGYAATAAVAAAPPHPVSAASSASECPFVSSSSATATVKRIFNWSSLTLPTALSRTWYGVIFRSIRRPGSESINLYEDDRQSHEEAVSSGGLILYWYGIPNVVTGENVATCIWTSREDAIKASRLPMHAKAARHSQAAYETFDLARYKVVKTAGKAELSIEEWDE